MKTIVKFMVIFGFVFQMSSQNDQLSSNEILNYSESKINLNFNQELLLYKSCKLLFAPQFGGLFNSSFEQVQGILNLKDYYDEYDLGMILGFTYKLINNLKFSAIYNIGILKFNFESSERIEGALIKTSLCCNF